KKAGKEPDGTGRKGGSEAGKHAEYALAQRSTGNIAKSGGQETRRPVQARDEVRGRLVLHHDGYGFVVPDTPIPQLDGDVFIPPPAVEDAMHGDHVLVKVERVSARGGRGGDGQRAEGRILRVLGRAHPSVVGLFRYGARGSQVVPYDSRMQH